MENIKFEEVVARNPLKTRWLFIVFLFYFLCGLFALLVSGYIEYEFFTGIFVDFSVMGFFLVFAFEGAKVGTIILHEYFKASNQIQIRGFVTVLNYITRTLLIIFSIVCSFSKISEYMDSPNFQKEWAAERQRIEVDFSDGVKSEVVAFDVQIAEQRNLVNFEADNVIGGVSEGPKYAAKKKLYDEAVANKIKRMNELKTQKENLLRKREQEIRDSPSSKNSILVGFFTTLTNSGLSLNFLMFYSFFVLTIAGFTTLIIEFIIWTVFSYLSLIFSGVWDMKWQTYVKATEIAEDAVVENFKEQIRQANLAQRIRTQYKKAINSVKGFVNSIHENKSKNGE